MRVRVVFRIPRLTLRKGERIVVPVAEVEVPCEDAWALDLPVSLPPEMRQRVHDPRARDLARLLTAPRVEHLLRLTNTGKAPFTTAPALILKGGTVLGQGTMTYTAPGMTVDLPVTAAVDVKITRGDRETGRVPESLFWRGHGYLRVDLEGEIALTNTLDRPVTVEVTRWVLGGVDGADRDGKVEAVSLFEDGDWATGPVPAWSRPWWWYGWNWPHWYAHLNGVGRVTWKVEVSPGKSETLTYGWHYFWE